ncbi:hypothetical protein V7S43_009906 [Phytophthora oleae]|uniref:Protein kinase domain-containing protein n=1 Tax=Phytophthora oleae TaxID=2107226 RepID=A0ABD3FEW3_9STRA
MITGERRSLLDTKEVQAQADAITKEADLNAFIAPYLNDVLARCGMVFVKSADPWLAQYVVPKDTTILKPDAFATHAGMYRVKPVPADGVQRGSGVRFGVAEIELLDCLILFERKLTITDDAFGQVIRYLENLSSTATACAVLCDLSSFWLIESYKSVVVKVEKSTWVTKGSKESLQKFIGQHVSPCVALLASACSSLGVDVVEGDAFLGRGAVGHVFKVTQAGGEEVLALKIGCYEDSIGRFIFEERALTNAQDTGLTVTPVEEVFELEVDGPIGADYTEIGAALLLSPVQDPLPHPTTQEEVQHLFELLWKLHTKGLVHNDPRVPNVIVSRGNFFGLALWKFHWNRTKRALR